MKYFMLEIEDAQKIAIAIGEAPARYMADALNLWKKGKIADTIMEESKPETSEVSASEES